MSLANSMEPIGMLSQQLNIIASVKASATGKYSKFLSISVSVNQKSCQFLPP